MSTEGEGQEHEGVGEHDFTVGDDLSHQLVAGAYCGTGEDGYVPPGEPVFDNTILRARALSQGIELTWNYPGINPAGVAFTKVYRSEANDFNTAILIAEAGGGYHFDMNNVEQLTIYYYWIRMYSVNDTLGPIVGPASAQILPNNQILIDMLEDQLNDSHLSQSLKTEIDRIGDISSGLSDEEQLRILGDTTLSDMWAELRVDLDYVDTLVADLTWEVITADSALAASIEIMLAKVDDNTAAITQESIVRADADSALAAQITTLEASAGEDNAAIQEQFLVVANNHNQLEAEVYAEYTLKLQVNDYISGFGLFNDGQTSDFIIHSDRFAVGKPLAPGTSPAEDTVYPFIIAPVNGQNVIALNGKAVIPDATITDAMVENLISSDDFVQGVSGWAIFKDLFGQGSYAEFNDLYARGNIEANSLKSGSADIIGTLMVIGEAIVAPASNFSSGNSVSVGFNAKGGTCIATVTCTVECDDSDVYINIQAGNQYHSVHVEANDTSGSGSARVTIPGAVSVASQSGVFAVTCSASISPGTSGKTATVKNMMITAAAYKR